MIVVFALPLSCISYTVSISLLPFEVIRVNCHRMYEFRLHVFSDSFFFSLKRKRRLHLGVVQVTRDHEQARDHISGKTNVVGLAR
jgi:hypothetical protein